MMNSHCRNGMYNSNFNNILNNQAFGNNHLSCNNTVNSCHNQNALGVQDSCTNENLLDSICCCVRKKMFL